MNLLGLAAPNRLRCQRAAGARPFGGSLRPRGLVVDRIAVIPLYTRDRRLVGHLIVDETDRGWANQWTWHLQASGYATRRASVVERRAGTSKNIYLHRSLLGLTMGDGLQADHINRDRLDCRRANLRIVEPGQNRQNTPSMGGSSRYRGVSWDRTKRKWMAGAQLQRRTYFLGRFDSEEDANAAVRAWRAKHMPWSEDAASA
jgi:hypothetical protein